jgi:hypothetical protein
VLLVVVGAASFRDAHAQADKAGAAVEAAKLVVEVIGGLSKWIGDQADDCSAAALGAAWGTHCNLRKRECERTGYLSAWCRLSDTESDNDCANGAGSGLAQEGLFGSWSGQTVTAYANAYTKPLHTSQDKHNARAWGKAKVDGDSQTDEDITPEQAGPEIREAPAVASVLAHVFVDTLVVRCAPTFASADTLTLTVDGEVEFSSIVSLEGSGLLSVTGDLSPDLFDYGYDAVSGQWQAALYNYDVAIPLGTVSVGSPVVYNVVLEASAGSETIELPTATGRNPRNDLMQNYPNPFNPQTSIAYSTENRGRVRLGVYGVAGQLVRILVDQVKPEGSYSVEWDGRDDGGHLVSSGVYFYTIQTPNFSQTRKMVLLK